MTHWPRISIVTPSYNQGAFIEATIKSVLDQGYPNLEYIIVDGGSTDGTVEIIRQYADRIAHWVSESDEGAADALAKGFRMATGEILAYLNSDDIYLPGTLHTIAAALGEENQADVAFGNMFWMDAKGEFTGERRQTRFNRIGYIFGASDLMQPATFWTRDLYLKAGGIDPSYRFAFDTDLFLRFAARRGRFKYIPRTLAAFRIHAASKSTNDGAVGAAEIGRLREEHVPVPFKSVRARVVRTLARAHRLLCYTLQGDAFWLLGRIPDRAMAPWESGIVGPRGRRV